MSSDRESFDRGSGSPGGIQVHKFDLSTARGQGDNDPERIRLGDAVSITFAQTPDVAYLRLGSPSNPKFDVRDPERLGFDSPPRYAFLQNPSGTGTLRLLAASGEAEVVPNTAIRTFNAAVDVTDRAAREIGKARMQDSAGTLIDPAEKFVNKTGVAHDQNTGGGALSAQAVDDGHHVGVKALPDNGSEVHVGEAGSVTTSNGVPLDPGESIELPVDDVSRIGYAVDNAGDGVAWAVEV